MNIDKLKGVIPDSVISQIDSVKEKFEINTALRLAHFLAQCSHESGGFKLTQENLNYSGKGLLVTFPRYFTTETAVLYERKAEKIANMVYANRMGNGDKASGDGWKFRGRGYIQLTGHDNYASFDKTVIEDVLASPELVATKYPLLSAAWFWNKAKINTVADGGPTSEVVAKVTRRVNGGVIGLDDRIKHFYQFHNLLIGSI